MTLMKIRRADDDDWPEVARVFIAARAGMSYLPKLHSDADTRAFIRRVVRRSAVWLAETDGTVVGFAALEPAPQQAWLHHLYVDPAAQNAGAGSALLEKARAELPGAFPLDVSGQSRRPPLLRAAWIERDAPDQRRRQRGGAAGHSL